MWERAAIASCNGRWKSIAGSPYPLFRPPSLSSSLSLSLIDSPSKLMPWTDDLMAGARARATTPIPPPTATPTNWFSGTSGTGTPQGAPLASSASTEMGPWNFLDPALEFNGPSTGTPVTPIASSRKRWQDIHQFYEANVKRLKRPEDVALFKRYMNVRMQCLYCAILTVRRPTGL